MAAISIEGRRVRPSKSLRAAIQEANRSASVDRQAEIDRRARDARERLQGAAWISETLKEKRERLAKQRCERDRSTAQKRADPQAALVAQHVTPEARAHGDYVPDTVAGPLIGKVGEEKPTSLTVVRNRGGTAVDRWHVRGDLDRQQVEAIAIYQRAHRLFFGGEQRTTANWSMVTSVRGGNTPIEIFVANQLQAKALLRHFDDALFFGLPLHYLEIWRNVVIFDEPTGVAGGRLGFKSKQAEAAAKTVVILIADMIATDQRLGNR